MYPVHHRQEAYSSTGLMCVLSKNNINADERHTVDLLRLWHSPPALWETDATCSWNHRELSTRTPRSCWERCTGSGVPSSMYDGSDWFLNFWEKRNMAHFALFIRIPQDVDVLNNTSMSSCRKTSVCGYREPESRATVAAYNFKSSANIL